jgi:hypothetical protein
MEIILQILVMRLSLLSRYLEGALYTSLERIIRTHCRQLAGVKN